MDILKIIRDHMQRQPVDCACEKCGDYVQLTVSINSDLDMLVKVPVCPCELESQAKVKDRCIALLNSMVNGGESHSDVSRSAVSAALSSSTCEWFRDEDGYPDWTSGCGKSWQLSEDDDDPRAVGMRFCPSCGRALIVNGQHA